jgi:hypothetical protein
MHPPHIALAGPGTIAIELHLSQQASEAGEQRLQEKHLEIPRPVRFRNSVTSR